MKKCPTNNTDHNECLLEYMCCPVCGFGSVNISSVRVYTASGKAKELHLTGDDDLTEGAPPEVEAWKEPRQHTVVLVGYCGNGCSWELELWNRRETVITTLLTAETNGHLNVRGSGPWRGVPVHLDVTQVIDEEEEVVYVLASSAPITTSDG